MVDQDKLKKIGRELLLAIGENPDREGIQDTPARFAKWWAEFIDYDPGKVATAFPAEQIDQMIIIKDIEVWTLCEHHLLPFKVKLDMAYISSDVILGLSKFARIAHKHAHKLQVQERLVNDIAQDIIALTGTRNVAVLGTGVHLCQVMRGIKTYGEMVTSHLDGVFKEDIAVRTEFLRLINGKGYDR